MGEGLALDDPGWLGRFSQLFSLPVVGWATLCALVVHWWKVRNERLRDRETEKSGDWTRLRDEIARLDDRCDHLQREVDDCRTREGEWMQRAITAEATLQGAGHARQEAANIVAVERLADKDTRKGQ